MLFSEDFVRRFRSHGNEDFNPSTYVLQFQEILDRIDEQVFSPQKAEITSTAIPKFFPGNHHEGYHIRGLISYRVIRPAHKTTIGLLGRDCIESYWIWGKEVEVSAAAKLSGVGTLKNYSDADFRQMLIACAVAAVRYRVLQHKQLFPMAKLRTVVSAYSDETIPEQHRRNLFRKKSEIPRDIAKDSFALDGYILLLLIDMLESDGRPLEDGLRYLTNT